MGERRSCDKTVLSAVRRAAMIFAPCHFRGIAIQIAPADVVMRSDFGAAQPREIGFRLIGAGPVRAECDGMIDAMHVIMRVQRIPATGFIGVDSRPERNALTNCRDGVALLAKDDMRRRLLLLRF
jgi:hypothetical protein